MTIPSVQKHFNTKLKCNYGLILRKQNKNKHNPSELVYEVEGNERIF